MILRVYIDIDGTILYDPPSGAGRDELDFQLVCDGLEDFLTFVRRNCEPYWLSYRARLGRRDALEERLFPHIPEVARLIPAAHWDQFKHEAIDPSSNFIWFEDDIEPEDKAWLASHGCTQSFVRLDASSHCNPGIMLDEVKRRLGVRAAP